MSGPREVYTPALYDALPYVSMAIPGTHPAQLGAVARLLGLEPPTVDGCRVLELGCGTGINVLSMAETLPGGSFVGVDGSARQIEVGRAVADAAGLGNVTLTLADILAPLESPGPYDYVVAHGVFSWVPERVRTRILAICRDHLSENGIACISYNTLPGWSRQATMRRLLLRHTAGTQDIRERLERAKALLHSLAGIPAPPGEKGDVGLSDLARSLVGRDSSYLFHEYLEPDNVPFYLTDVVNMAQTHGLRYAGESSLSTMGASTIADATLTRLEEEVFAGDVVQYEQYCDLLTQRTLRSSVFCRAHRAPSTSASPDRLDGLWFSSNITCAGRTVDLSCGVEQSFDVHLLGQPQRGSLTTDEADLKSTLVELDETAPECIEFGDLFSRVNARLAGIRVDVMDRPFRESVIEWLRIGLVEARTWPPPCGKASQVRPMTSPLARELARREMLVVTPLHPGLKVDKLAAFVLDAFDGTRTVEQVVEKLTRSVVAGECPLPAGARPGQERDVIERIVEAAVSDYGRLGLFQK